MKWPPLKTGGACCTHAPIPKLNLKSATNTADARAAQACEQNVDLTPLVCGSCRHEIRRFAIMPQGHTHFAQEVCGLCGRWLRWVPRPANVERQKLNAFRLAKLAMCDGLTNWERGFVASVSKQKKVSPKQQQIIDRLCATYLEKTQ